MIEEVVGASMLQWCLLIDTMASFNCVFLIDIGDTTLRTQPVTGNVTGLQQEAEVNIW